MIDHGVGGIYLLHLGGGEEEMSGRNSAAALWYREIPLRNSIEHQRNSALLCLPDRIRRKEKVRARRFDQKTLIRR